MNPITPRNTIRSLLVVAIAISLVASMSAPAAAGTSKTPFPDDDDNGYPNDGYYVTGVYNAYLYEDAGGNSVWDLGDGRLRAIIDGATTWTTIDEFDYYYDMLDQETLTTYTYHVQYRADFGNDPYMDDGWIRQTIHQQGYAGNGVTTYLIVSDEDRRFTDDPDRSIWGSWEIVVETHDGEGNVANPMHPEYAYT